MVIELRLLYFQLWSARKYALANQKKNAMCIFKAEVECLTQSKFLDK